MRHESRDRGDPADGSRLCTRRGTDSGRRRLSETVVVDGTTLRLNGMGLRAATPLRINASVGGLYLQAPSSDPAVVRGGRGQRRDDVLSIDASYPVRTGPSGGRRRRHPKPGQLPALRSRGSACVAWCLPAARAADARRIATGDAGRPSVARRDPEALAALHRSVCEACQTFLDRAVAERERSGDLVDRMVRAGQRLVQRIGIV